MKRRNFSKIMATTVAGTLATKGWANSSEIKVYEVRFGGPVFEKYNNPDEWISALQKLNYKAAYCPLDLNATSDEIRDYKKAAFESDIVISEVGAWSNPIDPHEAKQKAALQKCIDSLQLADEIGANCCVNISGSRNTENWAGPHNDNLTPDTFDLIVETTRKIIDAVKPVNSFYSLETMPWCYPDSVDSYERLFKAIDRKQFGVHFDPVNLVVSPQVYYKNGEMIKEAFRKLGPYIRSCHAKDILLLDDQLTPHMPEVRAGLGNLNYRAFLTELAKLKNIPLMMEHLNSAEDYNLAAKYIRSVGKENGISL